MTFDKTRTAFFLAVALLLNLGNMALSSSKLDIGRLADKAEQSGSRRLKHSRAGTGYPGASPAEQSATLAVEYLAQVMDQFHNRFPVYDDVSSAGNHFFTWTKFENANSPVSVNGSFTHNPHSGATAIQCVFSPTMALQFGGFVFQNGTLRGTEPVPQPNFGTEPDSGIDLTGATALTFWARGKQGGEVVDFFMGGVGWDSNTGMLMNPCTPTTTGPCQHPDSTRAIKTTLTLTSQWQQYSINLSGVPLNYVLGGFGWGTDNTRNLAGVEFYLDDIQYQLNSTRMSQRLNEPRFLRSFDTLPFQVQPAPVNDFDLVLRNSAFTYDNAVALLAFLANGSADSMRRAMLIGDAFVYASQHDRAYVDGRLRTDYSAGDISLPHGWTPNGRIGTVPIPGFYDETQQKFIEIEQSAIDTGNNTWAMIALLALYRQTSNQSYLLAARNLGNFIHTFRNDAGTFKGFQGGLDDYPETSMVTRRTYASTEHNLDVFAAFTRMSQLTGESQWQTDAQHAQQFVEAMWDTQTGCYLAGTTNPDTRNQIADQLPLDVQAWSVLALPNTLSLHPQVLGCAEQNHRNSNDGFSGFDFNNDRDGIWFEGTGQMATAYAFAHQSTFLAALRQELRRAQQTVPVGDTRGIAAASHNGLSTGFQFKYFLRRHVGATAWNVFAQLGYNPFYQTIAPTLQFSAGNFDVGEGDGRVVVTVTRTGDTSGTSTVDFATSNGTASQRTDYLVGNGTLTFTAGVTSRTFSVPLIDDVYAEADETVNLALSNPTGGGLAAPSTATITIADNDAAGPSVAQKRFGASFGGAEETPPNASLGSGQGYVLLNAAETSANVSFQFLNLWSPETVAHIHVGAPGVMGPILFPLNAPANPVTDQVISPTAQNVADLKAGQHYINIHSSNFPSGEIRGQLLWNPTMEGAFFVRQHYLDFLGREPDAGGLQFWVDRLNLNCISGAQCFHDNTIGVSDAFFFEPEFHQTAGYVFLVYRAAYGNSQPLHNPDGSNPAEANKLPEYAAFTADRSRVVGGANLTATQKAFANLFVTRTEFTTKYGAGLNTGALFVDAVLATIQADDNVDLTSQRTALIDQYNTAGGGNAGRAQVLYLLALDDAVNNPINNRAFVNAEYNRQFALTLYFGYLRRNPDIGGFLFWQSQINLAAVGDVPKQQALVCSFVTAPEYQLRFGPGTPRNNRECPQ